MNVAVIEGLRVSHGRQHVLRDVDLTVQPGEIWALVGVSGAGKSTLMRCVVALQAFDAGRISLGDFALRPGRLPPESALKPLRRRVGMVFQSHALFDHLTVRDNITLAPVHAAGVAASRAQEIALEWLGALGVAHRIDAFPSQLSGGEAQRVAIARALALEPGLLLMDEPTAALDPARRGALGETLGTLAAGGRGLLIATHDIEFAAQWSHRVAVLAAGEIVETGPSREVLTSPQHAATREFLRHSEHA